MRYYVDMKLKISKYGEKTYYKLWCPGCDELHMVDNGWGFDGNTESPTFDPSILVYGPEGTERLPKPLLRCHSFVRKGEWQFLNDSEHALAGKTAPMVDLPEWVARDD